MSKPTIVAGTDGSQSAERAVDKAAELAAALGATLHIVTSYSTNGAILAAAGGIAVPALHDDEARQEAEQIVARSSQRLADSGVEVRAHVCAGEAAEALMTIADDQGAEMIVVGNRGMTGARRVLGSVPNRISHHARCGVLIVPTC
jgi:nucleotide-binding universal stress UspA family protein